MTQKGNSSEKLDCFQQYDHVPEALPELIKAQNTEQDDKVLFSVNWAINAIAKKLGKTKEEAIEEFSNIRTGVIDKSAPKSKTTQVSKSSTVLFIFSLLFIYIVRSLVLIVKYFFLFLKYNVNRRMKNGSLRKFRNM